MTLFLLVCLTMNLIGAVISVLMIYAKLSCREAPWAGALLLSINYFLLLVSMRYLGWLP